MNLEYKILGNGTAVVLTRQPEIVHGEINVIFSGAPSDATAIFECDGIAIYRPLKDNACEIPGNKLTGAVKVTVAILDGSASPDKWVCEELLAEKQKNGGVLISPNDMNLPQRFIELKLENEDIRQTNARIAARLEKLEDRLTTLLEGYDLI